MKIDSAIKNFTERYDREAMDFVDRFANDPQLNLVESKIDACNVKDNFDSFKTWLEGYCAYLIEEDKDMGIDQVKASFNNFMEQKFDTKSPRIRVNTIPAFIESYISGIKSLLETVETITEKMKEADVNQELIGVVSETCDQFMEGIDDAFLSSMDSIVNASGYNFHKKLRDGFQKTEKPVFL